MTLNPAINARAASTEAVTGPDTLGGFDAVGPLRPLLESLCVRFKVPPDMWHDVFAGGCFPLGATVATLERQRDSSFVKAYVHLGRPVDEHAPALYRFLLTRTILQPAPFLFTAGIHPENESVFLCAALPWTADAGQEDDFGELLEALALVHDALHEELAAGIAWA